ncbi:carboxylesterase family protein [Cytobacillus praedii]|uniref:carboxylesterase family protein n=1 Tax=Cytobacillus praedii TaxID=1742358 RepID=UPI002E244C43|nr:carboxylesterase family protein [Cytobacillus praedii]
MNETTHCPSWKCPCGTIVGWEDNENEVVRATGIKYASSKRYTVPVAEPPIDGIIDATMWSPACPQPTDEYTGQFLNELTREMELDEHCQRLSVTAPLNAKPIDSLPVMVWIHGGSYVTGAGDHPMYNPAALVREQHIIVVTVTYRLGLFGYLGSEKGTPANLGLLDQIEALRWIKQNISCFGGNPENVTVFGESAGGDAVAHLMISKGTDELFKRAIIQSAPFGILRERNEMTNAMLEEATRTSIDGFIEDVAAAQSRIIEKGKSFGLKSSMPFGVQYGHFPLPNEENVDEAWENVASRVEVMVGCNNREVAPFIPLIPNLKRMTSVFIFGKFISWAVVKWLTSKIYGSGVKEFAERHSVGGGRGYKYTITWGPSGNKFAGGHATEIPLLFEDRDLWEHSPLLEGTSWEEYKRQGQALRKIWGEFARTGKVHDTNVQGLIKIESI